jgi:DNA modification methylase
MNDEFRQMVIEALRRGETLPAEWAPLLFPAQKREYQLTYAGKAREEEIIASTLAVPLQPERTFGTPLAADAWRNMLIFGDNLQAMKTLLEMKQAGKLCNADGTPGIRLVYIDPPFGTKQDFSGNQEQAAYRDKIAGAQFLEFLRRRLVLLAELLSPDGAMWVHLDTRRGHYVKTLLDELFGEPHFVDEIIWQRADAHSDIGQGARHFGAIHDTLFLFKKGQDLVWNSYFTPLPDSTTKKWYRHIEAESGRYYNKADLTGPGGAAKGNPVYEWKGITRAWRYSRAKMEKLENEGKIVYSGSGMPYLKRYLDESQGVPPQDVWSDIPMLRGFNVAERIHYPTQKPETLLERIIRLNSNPGDIVLDAFAGSGTTCAVAEKLGRRWIGIDCGKLAIYTIQKRLLSLKAGIGQKGKPLTPQPFTLYNAGLYDFSTLRQLPWQDWRFFALQLFGCRDEPHTIGGLALDGKRQGASVLVFDHLRQPGKRIDEETIQSIHAAVGDKMGNRFFIIAPRGVFDFQQDYLDLESVRYYALRIPYSFINELHQREFTALKQPADENDVNAIVDAVGFDFIRPPEVTWTAGMATPVTQDKRGAAVQPGMLVQACLHITGFASRAMIRGQDTRGGLETLSLVLVDLDYDGDLFVADQVHFAAELKANDWRIWMPPEAVGAQNMVVCIDIFGNEAREIVTAEQFGLPAPAMDDEG